MRSFPSITRRPVLLLLTLAPCWTVWEIARALGWVLKSPDKISLIVRNTLIEGGCGLVVCALLFLVYDRLRARFSLGTFLIAGLPLCYTAGILWSTTVITVMWLLGLNKLADLNAQNLLVGGGVMDGIMLALFSMLFLVVDHGLQLREQKEKAREATTLAERAQLQMLRYQLNPHFLFNSLNSIRAMILNEPERARQVVTELSEFLRYSLNGRGHESTIGEEMQAIDNYLAIQRIRFEERLVVTKRVDQGLLTFVLPCFLVHPLVENAVKYGMETCDPPLRLEIEVTALEQGLRICVSNTGYLMGPSSGEPGGPCDGTGTGLRNVAQRLELAFPGRHTFSVSERDGWVHAEIVLRSAAQEATS